MQCLIIAFSLCYILAVVGADYPGVIELVGYSNRRARTHYMPPEALNPTITNARNLPAAKMQADIETVKQNIEKYNKLLTLDTKHLPESQKDMLERIVERVARLKESLDIEVQEAANAASVAAATQSIIDTETVTTESQQGISLESETDVNQLLDETTLLQFQTSMEELAQSGTSVIGTTTPVADINTSDGASSSSSSSLSSSALTTDLNSELETQTEIDLILSTTPETLTDSTDVDDQFVAARSNNNLAAITADDSETAASTVSGSQRTLTTSKLSKTRATRRPQATATKPVSNTPNKRVSSRPAGGSSTSSGNIQKQNIGGTSNNNNNKQKPVSTTTGYTTAQPPQYSKLNGMQQKPLGQQKITSQTISDKMSSATPLTVTEQRITGTTITNSVPTLSAVGYGVGNTNTNIINNLNNLSNNNNDLVYDAPHVNTSSIIDSLNHAREEYYQQKLNGNLKDKKATATAKPTKYHYYPHNQHIYLLPECAIQQVCNAVYVRLNYTQPLCACPSRYRDPCSASLNEDDQHTTKLVGDGKKKAITLAKTCEATTEMRECRSPKDWSLLALQNTRTGKSHYLVICRCPEYFKMEGPMAHDQPTYASVPGIRVFGMMCVKPGYSIRKPAVQPPKRYQLQKPLYRPSNLGGSNSAPFSQEKDVYGRPGATSTTFHNNQEMYQQNQYQANYQYLNRPDTIASNTPNNNYRPDGMSINNFPGSNIYGRNNERQGDIPIDATNEDEDKLTLSTSTQTSDESRTTLTDSSSAEPDSTINERQKRSYYHYEENIDNLNDEIPEFPWDRVLEFQQSINWN